MDSSAQRVGFEPTCPEYPDHPISRYHKIQGPRYETDELRDHVGAPEHDAELLNVATPER